MKRRCPREWTKSFNKSFRDMQTSNRHKKLHVTSFVPSLFFVVILIFLAVVLQGSAATQKTNIHCTIPRETNNYCEFGEGVYWKSRRKKNNKGCTPSLVVWVLTCVAADILTWLVNCTRVKLCQHCTEIFRYFVTNYKWLLELPNSWCVLIDWKRYILNTSQWK